MQYLHPSIALAAVAALAAGAANAGPAGADQAAAGTQWERGALVEQLSTAGSLPPGEAVTAAPRVSIYFDQQATRPGLPPELGNTHRGRSIMLEYLQQARDNGRS